VPDKRERFVALAEKRVMRAIKDLRLVGNLANRNNYSYSDQDVQKILAVLDQEMKLLKNRFSAGESKPVPLFKL
jgi:hypothetical protein